MDRAALIFDLDGTLVTFKFDVQGTRRALLDELSRRGFSTEGLGLTTPTQDIVDSAEKQGGTDLVATDFIELKRRIYSILDEFEVLSAPTSAVFPGTRETLDYLKSKGVRLALLTNSGRKATTKLLDRAGLLDCFEFVMTRDDVTHMKPRSEGVSEAASRFKMPRESIYYVGDSLYDVRAAKSSGLKVISVATGNYADDRLKFEGADYVLHSISELPKILGL